jgi:tyrosine-protein phosphatase SIW14
MTRAITLQSQPIRFAQVMRAGYLALALFFCDLIAPNVQAFVQETRERVKGVANFGRVTDTYFRGGEVTPEGLKNLASLGVRTIIDLREERDEKEAEGCKQLGITYHSFPMTTEDTPDPGKVEKVVEIIQQAKSPVYVHCSGGKHRTGTVCAYFRIKHQGRSAEKAWQEQQAYGFGPPEEHVNLFLYIYGPTSIAKRLKTEPSVNSPEVGAVAEKREGKAKTESPADSTRGAGFDSAPATSAMPKASSGALSNAKAESLPHPQGHLSATANYISREQALELARDNGGSGKTIRINLEYDKKRSEPVWKVLLDSGTEYRLNALTGSFLGSKTKAEKLSYLKPLEFGRKYWTFQKIIAKAEQRGDEKVIEMELKFVRGRNRTFFEVMMGDGVTLFFDAASGSQIRAF